MKRALNPVVLNYLFVCSLLFFPIMAAASYVGPEDVVVGSWGMADNQFSFEEGDTFDLFPTSFFVLPDGSIIIADNKFKLFKSKLLQNAYSLKSGVTNFCNDGIIIQGIGLVDGKPGDPNIYYYGYNGNLIKTFPSNSIIGSVISVLDNCNFITKEVNEKYHKYSPLGTLLQDYTTKPLELGVVRETPAGSGQHSISVKYPEIIYRYIATYITNSYYKDLNGNLYGVEQLNDGNTISYRVHKYNTCSKEIAILTLPKAQYGPVPQTKWNYPSITPPPIAEYGEPIISSAGDVYCWARTPDQYKILKWTWTDDPNVPTGPDAPTNLAVAPSINGLYLTWNASPNDPGCVTGYEIAQATTSGGVYTTIATVNAGTLKYNDTTANAGMTYYYKVRAMAGSDPSAYTAEVSGKR